MRENLVICIVFSLLLTACGVPSGNPFLKIESPVNPQTNQPSPTPIPGTLVASIPVVEWKGSSKDHFLFPMDPTNGGALSDIASIPLGQYFSPSFSPDQYTLAVVGFVSGDHSHGRSLHLIDLKTWEGQIYELRLDGYINAIANSQILLADGTLQITSPG